MKFGVSCESDGQTQRREQLLLQVMREDGPALRRFVQSQTRDPAETEDVMQDMYIRILQNSASVHQSNSRRAYLFRIARNLIHDRLRQRQASARALSDFRAVLELNMQDVGLFHSPMQERAVRAREGGQAAAQAMQCLNEKNREIFCLSRLEGLRNKEIATRLGVPLRSVERYISEVSVFMRERLASYM